MHLLCALGVVAATAVASAFGSPVQQLQQLQQPLLRPAAAGHQTIGDALYNELERYARLVDIAYCIGGGGSGDGDGDGVVPGGLTAPFACASRCREFPEMRLVTTWHDGGGAAGRLGRLLLGDGGCGYVAVDTRGAGEVVVAFRGTYSLADTVVDLSTVPQAYEPYEGAGDGGDDKTKACANCTVHSGFLAAWRRTRGVVLSAVAAAAGLPYNGTVPAATAPLRIHLVGHSLGGAMAALAALEMRAGLGWPAVRVTTYGEPRIGNAALATYLEGIFGLETDDDVAATVAAYHRVTHQGDPVPLLPPADWGYRAHAGELYIATAALPPGAADVRVCRRRADAACLGGDGDEDDDDDDEDDEDDNGAVHIPLLPSYPWERVFAHRDYFWRLGLCVPGGDPANWGRRVGDV